MSSSSSLPLTCQCRGVQGRLLRPEGGGSRRVVCYCDDCQTYAHHLGTADAILDADGGSHVVMVTQSQIVIDAGHEHVACVRLGPRGAMRWYAACCNTPLANLAPNDQLPFAGLSYLTVRDAPGADALLGPVTLRTATSYARQEVPEPPHRWLAQLRIAAELVVKRLLGRHRPSPFTKPSGEPLSEPSVLTLEARQHAAREAGF